MGPHFSHVHLFTPHFFLYPSISIMHTRTPIILFVLGISLSGCAFQQRPITEDSLTTDEIYDWETTGKCAGEQELYGNDVIDIYRTNQPLRQEARAAIEDMLRETGLEPILSLRGIRGVERLSPQGCVWLYEQYNKEAEEPLSDERCAPPPEGTGNRFPEMDYHPLVFNTRELDGRYVLLLVDEEGLGGATLFGIVYDLDEKRLMTIDAERLNAGPLITHMTYKDQKLHYYWTAEYYPGIEEEECWGKKVARFDMRTGEVMRF